MFYNIAYIERPRTYTPPVYAVSRAALNILGTFYSEFKLIWDRLLPVKILTAMNSYRCNSYRSTTFHGTTLFLVMCNLFQILEKLVVRGFLRVFSSYNWQNVQYFNHIMSV